ncbi:hypothetical protein CL648_01105 [bacterium]|nr:hypothetical protein [bacterium]
MSLLKTQRLLVLSKKKETLMISINIFWKLKLSVRILKKPRLLANLFKPRKTLEVNLQYST